MESGLTFLCRGLVALLAILVAGCATLGPAPVVSLSVASFEPRESTLLETSVELTLRLTNESAQALTLAGSAHKVYVNDTHVGRAVGAERTVVPAFGSVPVKVTVYLDNLTLLTKAREFSQLARLAYRLESRLHPAEGAAFGDISVTTRGELDLAALGVVAPAATR
ncbi:MAG: LEA type 2 family protein [Verrucomicrobia bacterium]|jgi:LEA14-like dessication related protein|nr:LEA type 2 family protein [Verrucomicrobiota bacterium]